MYKAGFFFKISCMFYFTIRCFKLLDCVAKESFGKQEGEKKTIGSNHTLGNVEETHVFEKASTLLTADISTPPQQQSCYGKRWQ